MSEAFKVSVIIPVFNAEKFIGKAVQSALNETETGEVIIVEDGSSDHSLEVCHQLSRQSDRIRIFQHSDKSNHGAAASMNLGIIQSKFDFIAILGADDFFLPGRFKKEKDIFLSDPSVEGVYHATDAYALDEIGRSRLLNNNGTWLTSLNLRIAPENLFEHMAPVGGSGSFSLDGLTIKKSIFKKIGLLDPKMRLSQDTEISVKMAALCKLVPGELLHPVALFGLHENNRSQFPEKITANRPYMFYRLYKWSRKKRLKSSRIFLMWQRFYQYNLLIEKPSRRKQRTLLLKEFSKNPMLIRSRYFRKQLPIWSRIMS